MMAIFFNEKTKEFHLQGKTTSYIMKILKNGELGQLYFGKRIKHRDSFEHLFQMDKTGRSMTVNPIEGDVIFSPELLKQEYPAYGKGDFREAAYQILQGDGSKITEFEYVSHEIINGKPKLEGLPATYAEDEDETETLVVVLEDRVKKLQIKLLYTIFRDYDAIARSAKFVNKGSEKVFLTRALSGNVDLPDANFDLLHLSGAWARERHIKTKNLSHGIYRIDSKRGASSHHQNPFVALKRKNADEFSGEVYGFSLVYSGNFLAQVEVDHFDVARVNLGINPFDFKWMLEAGEVFQTPEMVMVYSDSGLNGMSRVYHKLYRERLARGKWRDRARPILINNWEATYFDFNEDKILDIAKTASGLGIELFVLDDGWFGKRDDDTTSLGDWFVDKKKLPNGLNGLASKVNELGMEFGLWFEPEMISKNSDLYRAHPDWLIQVPGRKLSSGRHQFVLDYSRKDVIDHIFHMLSEVLGSANIAYVKWDMNRSMSEIGSLDLSSEKQQELTHRYILGLYDLLERLTEKFPDVLFESCASGGGRFDPGMLYYMPQTWTSDDSDAVERLKIQYGTSMVYPLSSMGAHVSEVPNHQVGRITSVDMRGKVALFGTFGYELNLNKLNELDKKKVMGQIEFYKENRELIQKGEFYRLKSPFEENETAWMAVSKDNREALVGHYTVLAMPNPSYKRLKLTGLSPDILYRVEELGIEAYGDELMNVGIMLNPDYTGTSLGGSEESGDFKGRIFKIKAV
jgi:alpha-galactosidase